MAWLAQSLYVVSLVKTAFCQRRDVVTLGCKRDVAKLPALDAQRLAPEQVGAHGLQPTAGDALC